MNKIGKRIGSVALCLSVLLGASFVPNERVPSVQADTGVTIWYEDSETYIYQTETYAEKNTSKLEISMAKNEYESGQIILTPTKDIKAYDITVSDLYCGENVIAKEDISVYNEVYTYSERDHKYINGYVGYVTEQYIPDALVPFDAAKAAGENTVKANNNQGLYVTVKTDKETAAGTYTGTFTVTADGTQYDVPVSVTVWDLTVSDEVNTASIFLLYNDYLVNSIEGDATDETLKLYYDFFLDHRLSLMYLPTTTNKVDRFLELLVEYYDHLAFTAYEIPYSWATYFDYTNPLLNSGYPQPNLTELQDTVNKIVAMSVRDNKNYLEKGYVYNIYVDEFFLDDPSTVKYNMGVNWGRDYAQFLVDCVADLDAAYGEEYLDSVEGLRFSLEHLTNLNAGSDVQIGVHVPGNKYNYNSVMPEPDAFNNPSVADSLYNDYSEEGDEIWWYTCVGPVGPYPNYHLSNANSLLDARLLSWMQYDYNIVGNLYYLVNSWLIGTGDLRYDEDLYTDHKGYGAGEAHNGTYGDGLLIYPGAQYGLKAPISTLRLESIRDGLEDYALIETVDKKYEELSAYYDTKLSGESILDSIFAKVYSGTISYKNPANLQSARTVLTDTLNSLSTDAKVLLESSGAQGDEYYASVLVAGDYTVEGNYVSKEACGNGYRYNFKYTRGSEDIYLNFVAKKGTESYETNILLERAPVTMVAFNSAEDLALATLTKNSTSEISTIAGKTAMKVTLASSAKLSEIATFKPKVEFKADVFKAVLNEANEFTVNLYNAHNEEVQLMVTMSTNTKKTVLKTITLKANSWNEVLLSDIYNVKDAVKISFEFENIVGILGAVNYDIYFSNLAYKGS